MTIEALIRAREAVAAHANMRERRKDGKGTAYASDDLIPLAAHALAKEGLVLAPVAVDHRMETTATSKGDVPVWLCSVRWQLLGMDPPLELASTGAVLGSNTADAASGAFTAAQRKLIEVLFGLRGQDDSKIARSIARAQEPQPEPSQPPTVDQRLVKARAAMEVAGRHDIVDAIDAAADSGQGVEAALAAARAALLSARKASAPAPKTAPVPSPAVDDDGPL
jgi:hypothetical protein